MDDNAIIKTQMTVFKRALHILALLQNPESHTEWNTSTLADTLSSDDPFPDGLSKKHIDVAKKLLRNMGFNIPKHSGDRSIPLEESLDKAEAEKILFSYLPMVVHQMTIEEIVKSSFAVNPGMLLYLLARIFFAAKQKLVIELTYKSSRNENENKYILHPYYWVYREQSIYLVAYNTARTQEEIFRITRISSVRVLEKKYSEEPPDVREIFQNSGGVFVNDRHYDIVLSAAAGEMNLLSENFGHLDASVREDCGRVEFSFSISDLYWLCQRLLPLEGRIKITGSDETVLRVKQMMKSALKNFF